MYIFGLIMTIVILLYYFYIKSEKKTLSLILILLLFGYLVIYKVPIDHFFEVLLYNISNYLIYLIIFLVILFSSNLLSRSKYYDDFNLILQKLFFKEESQAIFLYFTGLLIVGNNSLINLMVLVAYLNLFQLKKIVNYVILMMIMITNIFFQFDFNSTIDLFNTTEEYYKVFILNGTFYISLMLISYILIYLTSFTSKRIDKKIKFNVIYLVVFLIIGIISWFTLGLISTNILLIILISIITLTFNYIDIGEVSVSSRYKDFSLVLSIGIVLIYISSLYLIGHSYISPVFLLVIIIAGLIYENKEKVFNQKFNNQIIVVSIGLFILYTSSIMLFNSDFNNSNIGTNFAQVIFLNFNNLINSIWQILFSILSANGFLGGIISGQQIQEYNIFNYYLIQVIQISIISNVYIQIILVELLEIDYKDRFQLVGSSIVFISLLIIFFTIIINNLGAI